MFNSLAYHQNNVIVKLHKIATGNANELTKYSQEIKTFIFS